MDTPAKTRVVIAGGGTAGWLAAALFMRQLRPLVDVVLVESEEIGTVGVGEATIPTVQAFHALIGVDEREFMAATGATFKLGIAFEGWARTDDRYIHSFGDVGRATWMGDFQHFWLEAQANGDAGPFSDYCLELQAAEAGRFATGQTGRRLNHAYHFDAGRYAKYLRARCEAAGLTRREGRIARVDRDPGTGHITALALDDGSRVEGDIFLDCTGFRGLLIGDTLGVGYEDWGHWLPADRALAVQTTSVEPARPYTRAIAHDAGWQWRIPLQNRIGNGHVYSSRHLSDDAAAAALTGWLEGEAMAEPQLLRVRAGRRTRAWAGNCVALGQAAGFLEPLESTSLALIQSGIERLLALLPDRGCAPALADEYNRVTALEHERLRDFLVLHYAANARHGEAFWDERRDTALPPMLAHKLRLFRARGHLVQYDGETFGDSSWLSLYAGLGVEAAAHDPMADHFSVDDVQAAITRMKASIADTVALAEPHEAFLARAVRD